jgi:hypothetical protein
MRKGSRIFGASRLPDIAVGATTLQQQGESFSLTCRSDCRAFRAGLRHNDLALALIGRLKRG